MYNSIEEKYNYKDYFMDEIKKFGGVGRKDKYVMRDNTEFPNKGAFFGCINEEEGPLRIYSDLSIVIFPSNEAKDADDRWIIALSVGSSGFKNDYDIVSLPGTRRLFMKHLVEDTFIKNDFTDISSPDGFSSFCKKNKVPVTLHDAEKKYAKENLVSTIFDPNEEEATKEIISKYLALYAKLREWPSNDTQRKNVEKALKTKQYAIDDLDNVKKLIEKRKYVVLQGAPGTGKTRLAKKLAAEAVENGNVFFTQFHAETTYSDFIYGIYPDVKPKSESKELCYIDKEGIFVKAIRKAQEDENKPVYLIIDEINRANLSNVLGASFYLFEPMMANNNIKIEVCPGLELAELPENLYVIATMNTADRSLAVIDFALRRRFAWYTIFPQEIKADEGQYFCEKEFNDISEIFEKYASDEELNLQPGHAYFIVPDGEPDAIKDAINDRIRYEIMPLIKEYLLDGMLSRAKDDFVNYFREEIKEEMFK